MLIIMLHVWHPERLFKGGVHSQIKVSIEAIKHFGLKLPYQRRFYLHTWKKNYEKKPKKNKQTNKQKKNKTPKYFPGGMKNNM